MKRKVIFDCDPGLDDALALLLAVASDKLDILAITTIAGNSTIEKTSQNALDLMERFGRPDIPVARGSGNPIIGRFSTGEHVHGSKGIGGIELKKSDSSLHPLRAHELIRKILLDSEEKVTIIATGPLTNIGIALSLYPEIFEKIEMISMMGGSASVGNVGAVMEANTFNDPEAAHIVFNSGLPIAMFGLNVTYQTVVYQHEFDRIESIGSELAKLAASFNRLHYKFYEGKPFFKGDPSHDSCAVAYLLNPELFQMEHLNVVVDLTGEFSRGQTIIDQHGVTGRAPNAWVALSSDRDGFAQLVYESVLALSKRLG